MQHEPDMSQLDALLEFERRADGKVANLPLWSLPLRSILTAFYLSADRMVTGGQICAATVPNPIQAATLFGRLSYLTSFFSTSSMLMAADVEDAMSVFTGSESLQRQLGEVLSYAHFCELMPQVRKGYLLAEQVPGGFRLSHPSEAFSQDEERDILLSELSLACEVRKPPILAHRFDSLAMRWPLVQPSGLKDKFYILQVLSEHYGSAIQETSLLPNAVYEENWGFTLEEFRQFRAAMMSIADFCIGMAAASARKWHKKKGRKRVRWEREWMEWTAPFLRADYVFALVHSLTGFSTEKISVLVEPFSMDVKSGNCKKAGDGYFPPLMRIADGFLFSAHALKEMLPQRNLLYVMNKDRKSLFDSKVSGFLEPQLLSEVEGILSGIPGVCSARNVNWDGGEIDLLVVQPSEGVALQIQAKAALPPQGARMTHQVEQNTLKAVKQLKKFSDLPAAVRDELCTRQFGFSLSNLSWISAVVTRTSFGTKHAWSSLSGISAFNPPLLRAALCKLKQQATPSLLALPAALEECLQGALEDTMGGWIPTTIRVFDTDIEVPLLTVDQSRMAVIRRGLAAC